MTLRSPLAKLALRALADASADVEPPSPSDEDAAIAAIARELEARRRSRRLRGAVLATVSFAAAAALVVALGDGARRAGQAATVESVSGTVLVVRGQEGVTLGHGARVGRGDRVVASAAGSTTLRLPKGTELRAMGGADVLVAEQGRVEVLELRAGAVQLHVAKLSSGDRFIVKTTDTEVEVRGTQFRVEVAEPCAGTTTRVSVAEGIVVVRHAGSETRLLAKESWPMSCGAPIVAPPPAQVAMPAPSQEARPEPAAIPVGAVSSAAAAPIVAPAPPRSSSAQRSATASSELAEQNRLFTEAMAAKRRGDVAVALGALDRLMSAYPQGPLAESAAVERMRILAASDPARAAEAARTYLARHPNGYARGEALKLTGSP